MNKVFHQLAPIITLNQMPKEFQDFMITNDFTLEKIQKIADLPDLVDLDNIEQDPFCRHAHSYKMNTINDKLQYVDGDALERVKGLSIDAYDYYKEKDFDQVRYCLSKVTHYLIDSKTFPHIHIGKPWSEYHQKFEENMGKFITKNKNNISKFEFESYKNVFDDCAKESEELWDIGNKVVNDYINKKKLDQEIALDVINRCIQGIGNLWLTIAIELKIV